MKIELSTQEIKFIIDLIKSQPVSVSRDFYAEELTESLLYKLKIK